MMYQQANAYAQCMNESGLGTLRSPPRGGLEGEAENLFHACEEMEKAISALAVRLEPFLMPTSPNACGSEKAGTPIASSPLRSQFASIGERLHQFLARLDDL